MQFLPQDIAKLILNPKISMQNFEQPCAPYKIASTWRIILYTVMLTIGYGTSYIKELSSTIKVHTF